MTRQPGRVEEGLDHLGDRGLGDESENQGCDRDAQLGTGEVERDVPDRVEDARGLLVTGFGLFLETFPVDGDQSELSGNVEGLTHDQDDDGE